jgi:hypothetical protein
VEAGGSQLDGEGNPIEALTQTRHQLAVGVGHGEVGPDQAGALGEELDRSGVVVDP